MKWLKYIHRTIVIDGVDENGKSIEREVLTEMAVPDTESGRALAEKEAYGEIIEYDDGELEPETEPTTEEILNAMLGVE